MIVIVNGRKLGSKETGCALCGATWGEYYEEVDGERLFFCCDLCAKGFRSIVNEAKRRRNWDHVDEVVINGNFSMGRNCTLKGGGEEYRFYVKFNDDAEISIFRELS